MFCKCLFVFLFVVHCSSQLYNNGGEPLAGGSRVVRQLGLGNVLNPVNNQDARVNGIPCEGPQRQKGRCLPMDQCVLRELDEDYIKYQAYLCTLAPQGPVGVCCPNSISRPVPYRAGMFANKYGGRSDAEQLASTTSRPPRSFMPRVG